MTTTKITDLSIAYMKRIMTLINNSKKWKANTQKITADDLSWVDTQSEELIDYIQTTYSNLESRKGYLSAIAKVLETNPDKNKMINEKVAKLRDINNANEADNKLSIQEQANYKKYPDIIAIREEAKDTFLKDPKNNENNIKYLILCLYTMTPPLRTEWINLPIVSSADEWTEGHNVLVVNKKKYDLIIDHDKVSNKAETLRYTLPNDLTAIIKESLVHYPREMVLSPPDRNRGKALSYNRLNDFLVSYGLSVGNLRSAYISHQYSQKGMTYKRKLELAKRMRHSVSSGELYYNKIDI